MAERAPSAKERALWRRATEGVRPLRQAAPPPVPPVLPEEAVPTAPAQRRPHRAAPSPNLPAIASGAPSGLDRRTAQRFRRGEMAIEARLDLHGMTQDEAHRALDQFLDRAEAAGKRSLLVITGKGARPGAPSSGVLRASVPRWLNEAPNRARLVAFAPAQAKDGGAGALYLLLRRRR